MKYTREQIIENLKAAGCDNCCIEEYLELTKEGKEFQCDKLLQKHRRELLDKLHEEQRRIDTLDYFTYTKKKEDIR